MRVFCFGIFISSVLADCRNVANIESLSKPNVVDVQLQIAARNQFDGIENGRLLVTPNVDIPAAMHQLQINPSFLDNGGLKQWVKTWVSFTKSNSSNNNNIEHLFASIVPECSFENLVRYNNVDTNKCLGQRSTSSAPCDFTGNEGCKSLYDFDVTYTMCFIRTNQTNNCVSLDRMPTLWERPTQTTMSTDAYICVRYVDRSKNVELEYVEPTNYIITNSTAVGSGFFVTIPPIEVRDFEAEFCTKELDINSKERLVAATRNALSDLLDIDVGNVILTLENITTRTCSLATASRRRQLNDGDDIDSMNPTASPTQAPTNSSALSQAPTPAPTVKFTQAPTLNPTFAPTQQTFFTSKVSGQIRTVNEIAVQQKTYDAIAGPAQLENIRDNVTAFIEQELGVTARVNKFNVVPIAISEEPKESSVSFLEAMLIAYGIYFALLFSLEVVLAGIRDYEQLYGLYPKDRVYLLEQYHRQLDYNRSSAGELGIFKMCCRHSVAARHDHDCPDTAPCVLRRTD